MDSETSTVSSQPVQSKGEAVTKMKKVRGAQGSQTSKSNDSELKLLEKIKELRAVLESAGYQVRREELKRGPGWRAVSGACRLKSDRLILIDRRLSASEQVEFLSARVGELSP